MSVLKPMPSSPWMQVQCQKEPFQEMQKNYITVSFTFRERGMKPRKFNRLYHFPGDYLIVMDRKMFQLLLFTDCFTFPKMAIQSREKVLSLQIDFTELVAIIPWQTGCMATWHVQQSLATFISRNSLNKLTSFEAAIQVVAMLSSQELRDRSN